jgi:hypothetical protein
MVKRVLTAGALALLARVRAMPGRMVSGDSGALLRLLSIRSSHGNDHAGKPEKIRLDARRAGRSDPGVHERRICRGLYNWIVMRLQYGAHWHFAEEKARLSACQAYDPELNDVYGKVQDASVLPTGQSHTRLLPPRQGW